MAEGKTYALCKGSDAGRGPAVVDEAATRPDSGRGRGRRNGRFGQGGTVPDAFNHVEDGLVGPHVMDRRL
jgi:hypothetical protein